MPESFWQQTPEATDNPIALNLGRFFLAVLGWGFGWTFNPGYMTKWTKDFWEFPYLFLTVILIVIGIGVTVFLWIKSHRKEMKEQAEAKAKEEAEAKKTKQR